MLISTEISWNFGNGRNTVRFSCCRNFCYVAGTPGQAAIEAAYLDAIPWGTPEERKRAFALACVLAVIKEMHHEWRWAEIMGWKDGNPEWNAQLIHRLWQHAARVKKR